MNLRSLFAAACKAVDEDEDSFFGGLDRYSRHVEQVERQHNRFLIVYLNAAIRLKQSKWLHCKPHVPSLYNPKADQVWCAKCNSIIREAAIKESSVQAVMRRQRKRGRRHHGSI